MDNKHNQTDQQQSSGESRSAKVLSLARFSIKSLLLLTTLIAIFFVAICVNYSIQESKSVSDFVGPKVKGKVKEYRPRAIAKITPNFLKRLIGEQYFQTAHSASVYIYLDPAERHQYHRAQSPELVIRCISNFLNLRYLSLSFSGSNPYEPIDLSPLVRCRGIRQLELSGPNAQIVKDICKHVKLKCLALNGCELEDEMIEAITTSSHIESIQFNFCAITAKQLQSLKGMENLRRIHFFDCRPIEKKDGSFDFQIEQMTGGKPFTIVEHHSPLKAKAREWLQKELPGVTISGLY